MASMIGMPLFIKSFLPLASCRRNSYGTQPFFLWKPTLSPSHYSGLFILVAVTEGSERMVERYLKKRHQHAFLGDSSGRWVIVQR